jgi:prepilin-type N-terminal cleavage/methylation domain-containing protein
MKNYPMNKSWRNETGLRTSHAFGFTLLELLVVIALVVILTGLLVGGVTHAKMAAHRVTCMNNLKQWGLAAHLYAHDSEDELPREAAVDGINSWEVTAVSANRDVWYNALAEKAGVPTMAHYAQTPSSQQDFYSAGKLFHCPEARFSEVAATYPNFSLAINSKLMRDFEDRTVPAPFPLSDGSWGCKLSEIKEPDRTALFLDNGIPGEERLCAFQPAYAGEPKACASEFSGRHGRAGNILFAAGHVQTMAGKDVVQMNPDSVFRGRAIFPPIQVIWCRDPALVP